VQNGQLVKTTLSASPHTLVHGYWMPFFLGNEMGNCSRYCSWPSRVLRTPYANVPGFEYLSMPGRGKSRRIVLTCPIIRVSSAAARMVN